MTMTNERTPLKAWRMLALSVAAQTAGTVFLTAPAFLIPLVHSTLGIPLVTAGFIAAAPTFGAVFTLVAWGALTDRIGERLVISIGLALTALSALGAVLSPGFESLVVFLVIGGAASASTNSASGRVVVAWFPRSRRGFAMGIRQMAQPLGVTIAALTVPALASSFGVGGALALPLVLTGVVAIACGIGIENRTRAATSEGDAPAANPYRSSAFLWRIHIVSLLLVIPQFTLSTFGLVWLISDVGLLPPAAGIIVGAAQFVGALGRIGVGVWSDRLGSRVRLLRWVAIAAATSLLLVALADATSLPIAAALAFVVATTVSVADNGLAFTSVAEASGPAWSGKALGVQNTGQYIAASAVGPSLAALITVFGFPLAFAFAAIAPLAAVPIVPAADVHRED